MYSRVRMARMAQKRVWDLRAEVVGMAEQTGEDWRNSTEDSTGW